MFKLIPLDDLRILADKQMKPYQQVPILECGEPLVPIVGSFVIETPHPYQVLGATYHSSPYYLRQTVLDKLQNAQTVLQKSHPNWQILIFDAYRPIAVQQFMVDYTFAQVVQAQGLIADKLSESQQDRIRQQVYQIWAVPSLDPRTPPPHSTGGAVDITLVDDSGKTVNMGSPIDELSPRSHPDYFAHSTNREEQQYHAHRQLLKDVMYLAGFMRHPGEWWHFCYGDQMYAWLKQQENPDIVPVAKYGCVE